MELCKSAEKDLKNGIFDYLELYAIPNSFAETQKIAKQMFSDIKTVIHAPHTGHDMLLSEKEELSNNIKRFESSQYFADILHADIIILHPGINKRVEDMEETVRQILIINDNRIAIENVPTFCNASNRDLHGSTPEEIKLIKDGANCKFCLDFSHAFCSENAYKKKKYEYVKEYLKLKPDMFHLCDGMSDEINDKHLHFGEGNYDLSYVINNFIPDESFVSIETGKGLITNTDLWVKDASYFHNLEK